MAQWVENSWSEGGTLNFHLWVFLTSGMGHTATVIYKQTTTLISEKRVSHIGLDVDCVSHYFDSLCSDVFVGIKIQLS